MRLFTFPYAFGTDAMYHDLEKALSHRINIKNMNYPGHGYRIQEKVSHSIEELASDAIELIKKTNEDYALLGYSMGAKVCCEVVRQLHGTPYRQPKHVFLLASPPPSNVSKISKTGDIDLEEAREILRVRGNTPQEVIDSQEMMEFIFPIIEGDVKSLESYHCPSWPFDTFDIPATMINGHDDFAVESEQEWRAFFPEDAICDFFKLDGGHLFLFENKENFKVVTEIILNKLT
ncbi:MAG: thioesterase domain-containing protein [Turicibacter sp.]|nr:thioesterase domain-containing protein [Turicibacter sp.]